MSKLQAYLTIDDSPSAGSHQLVDFLASRNIPAMLFCRGDRLEQNPAPMVRAIKNGMVLANHNYSHRPAGDLSYDEVITEIEQTERLIDAAYRAAGVSRPGKYFRFPYLDKGDGDRIEQRFGEIIDAAVRGDILDLAGNEKVRRIQDYLKTEGFSQPYQNVTHPLYQNPAIGGGADCMLTYTSGDWMLTARHKGKWPYQSIDDLKQRMDDDPWLCREGGAQILLLHDDPEIQTVVFALIDYMYEKRFTFLA